MRITAAPGNGVFWHRVRGINSVTIVSGAAVRASQPNIRIPQRWIQPDELLHQPDTINPAPPNGGMRVRSQRKSGFFAFLIPS
jgi:hypothetical protein